MLNFSFCKDSDIVTNNCRKVDGVKLVSSVDGHYVLNGIKDCNVNGSSEVSINKCSPLGIRSEFPSIWELGVYKSQP